MRFNRALYLKELKQHRAVFAFYFALSALVAVMIWMNESWFSIPLSQKRTYMLYWMELGLELFLPGLLVYSWFREQSGKTSYQLLSLPVKSPAILLHKYLAFCTAILAASLMYIPGLLIQSHSNTAHPVLMGFALFLFLPVWQIALLEFTILVIGKGHEYHKHRLLYGLGTGGVFFLIIVIFQNPVYLMLSSNNVYLFHTHIDNATMLLLVNLMLVIGIPLRLFSGLPKFEKYIDG